MFERTIAPLLLTVAGCSLVLEPDECLKSADCAACESCENGACVPDPSRACEAPPRPDGGIASGPDGGGPRDAGDGGATTAPREDAGPALVGCGVGGPGDVAWTRRAGLATPRVRFGAAALDGKIYVVGGSNAESLSSLEVYDPAVDRWTELAPMPTPRESLVVGAIGGKLYAAGGYTTRGSSSGFAPATEVYDPHTDTWSTKQSVPLGGAQLLTGYNPIAGGVVGDRLYLAHLMDNVASATFEYDPVSDRWTERRPFPIDQLFSSSIVAVGGASTLLVLQDGGMGLTGLLLEYRPDRDEWRLLPRLPVPELGVVLFGPVLARLGEEVYSFGGNEYGDAMDHHAHVRRLDRDLGRWESHPPLVHARHSAVAVELDGKLYLIGGSDSDWPMAAVPLGLVEVGCVNPR